MRFIIREFFGYYRKSSLFQQ